MRVFSSCSHVFLRHKNQGKKSAKTFLSIITKLSPFSNTKMYFFKSTKKVHRLSDSLERRQKKRRATFLALPHWVNLPYYDYCASLIKKSWYHPSHNSLSLSLSFSQSSSATLFMREASRWRPLWQCVSGPTLHLGDVGDLAWKVNYLLWDTSLKLTLIYTIIR